MRRLEATPAGRRYGFWKSPPDHRDFGAASAPLAKALPSVVDLSNYCGPVFDQGNEGSCTANAGAGNFEFLLRKFHNDDTILSRAFLYYQERLLDGSIGEGDCGSTGRSSCKAMNKFGVCAESDMPYVAGSFDLAPSAAQLAAARKFVSGAYHALNTVADIKSCLASGFPALLGFVVYESFEMGWSTPGYMPIPKPTEEILGGHETLIIGYDDSKSACLVRNSWGTSWGLNGNFWFPYSALADPNVFEESWIQHLGKPW